LSTDDIVIDAGVGVVGDLVCRDPRTQARCQVHGVERSALPVSLSAARVSKGLRGDLA
jgi:hypothetical protein